MCTEQNLFDIQAAEWDENPRRAQLTADVFEAIRQAIPLNSAMNVLDFGCGTGTLAMRLAPLVGAVTGADTSQGMLEVFKRKADACHTVSVRTMLLDAAGYASLQGPFDLVVSVMTLHHVEAIEPLLAHLLSILAPGGHIALVDLDPENGLFHGENAGVFHNGFDRAALCRLLEETGFADVRSANAAATVKPDAHGELRRFTLFLASGQRP